MIYIDFNNNISDCVFCAARQIKPCSCATIEVYVYEITIFWDFEGAPKEFSDNNSQKFRKYQIEHKYFEEKLRKKFPLAKEFIYYPHAT